MKKRTPSIQKNDKLKGAFGVTHFEGKKAVKIEINVKKHATTPFKKSYTVKDNVVDTIVHEKMHARNPNMTEKEVRSRTAQVMKRMPEQEKSQILSTSGIKVTPQMEAVLKKKLGFKKGEEIKPGDMLERLNERKRVAINGLI